jgi:hypothetical protein
MATKISQPLWEAWKQKQQEMKAFTKSLMDAAGLTDQNQLYTFLHGTSKKPLTDVQKEKVAALFGKPVKTLFPPQSYFE